MFIATGTHYEMGYQQGLEFKEQIKYCYKRMLKFEGIKLVKPKFMPNFLFSKIFKRKISNKFKKPIENISHLQTERIEGISKGANIDINELYCVQALEILADEVHFVMSCSALAILPQISTERVLIIGKNFDYIDYFSEYNLIRVSKPKNKYKSIEFTFSPLAGSHDGLNEKGLTVIYNYGVTKEYTKTRLPITLLVQEILENCATTEEAISVIENFRYPNGAILLISDFKNDVRIVEISPEHISVRYPKDGFIACTNFFLSEEMRDYDIPHNACYSKKAPKSLRGKRIHESNELRYHRLLELIKIYKKINLDAVKQILSDHGGKNSSGDDNTICRHNSFSPTQLSIIFIPRHRKLYVSTTNPCFSHYKQYNLDNLF